MTKRLSRILPLICLAVAATLADGSEPPSRLLAFRPASAAVLPSEGLYEGATQDGGLLNFDLTATTGGGFTVGCLRIVSTFGGILTRRAALWFKDFATASDGTWGSLDSEAAGWVWESIACYSGGRGGNRDELRVKGTPVSETEISVIFTIIFYKGTSNEIDRQHTETVIARRKFGTIEFSAAGYSVREDAGQATITVRRQFPERSGLSAIPQETGQVTVDYRTTAQSATAGVDYTTTTGTLTFDPGYSDKTFTVPIIQDRAPEGNETVLLTLSNPTGGPTLGARSTAVLTITDLPSVDLSLVASTSTATPGQVFGYTARGSWDSQDGSPSGASRFWISVPSYADLVADTLVASSGVVTYEREARLVGWTGSLRDDERVTVSYDVKVSCSTVAVPNASWPITLSATAAGLIGGELVSSSYATALSRPELRITGMEVTQAVQNLQNDQALIRDKDTFVRLYVSSGYPGQDAGCDVPQVPAVLTGPGGAQLAAQPVDARGPSSFRPTVADRSTLSSALFWRLPLTWTQGTYDLEADLNPGCTRPDADCSNNHRTQRVSFTTPGTLYLYFYAMKIKDRVPSRRLSEAIVKGLRLLPLADRDIRVYWMSTIDRAATGGDLTAVCTAGPPDFLVDEQCLLRAISYQRPWSWFESSNVYYVGILHQETNTDYADGTGFTAGIAEAIPGRVMWVKLLSAVFEAGEAGRTLAHELAHLLGRHHVDCPVGVPAGADNAYPYTSCFTGEGTSQGYWGFDGKPDVNRPDVAVMDPRVYADIMSYSPKQWISHYTYDAVLQRVSAAPASITVRSTGPRFLVQGVITPTSSSGAIEDVDVFENPTYQDDVATGPYALELQDVTGQVLASRTFTATSVLDAPKSAGIFFQRTLSYDARASRIVLKSGSSTLATISASPNPPTVTVTSPNGGETITDTLRVAWSATDPDGSALRFVVQYSHDNGVTWVPLAVNITTTSLAVTATRLAGGSQSLVRVTASDGFRSAADQSNGTFVVPRRPPIATISEPDSGSVLAPGTTLTLRGRAYDQAFVDLTGASLQWRSDRDGSLGSGENVDASSLSPGTHVITLTATDSSGASASVSASVYVGYQLGLPVIMR